MAMNHDMAEQLARRIRTVLGEFNDDNKGVETLVRELAEYRRVHLTQPAQAKTKGDERSHFICICPDCVSKPAQAVDVETYKALLKESQEDHLACIKDAYRLLGIDGSDGEYRYKWVALEIANITRTLAGEQAGWRVPDAKPLPDLMMANYHEAVGWNACRDAMLAALPASPAPDKDQR